MEASNASLGGTAKPTRLIVFYIVLGLLTAAVAIVVIAKGKDEKPQPPIAGGYDATVANSCLGEMSTAKKVVYPSTAPAQAPPAGPSFDVKQSGQFVNLSNTQGTLGAKLRLEGGPRRPRASSPATSAASTASKQPLDATRHAGQQGLDHRHARRASPHGQPQARPARSGSHEAARRRRASPASTRCRRARRASAGPSSSSRRRLLRTRSRPRGRSSGEVAYDKPTGAVTGDVAACAAARAA